MLGLSTVPKGKMIHTMIRMWLFCLLILQTNYVVQFQNVNFIRWLIVSGVKCDVSIFNTSGVRADFCWQKVMSVSHDNIVVIINSSFSYLTYLVVNVFYNLLTVTWTWSLSGRLADREQWHDEGLGMYDRFASRRTRYSN